MVIALTEILLYLVISMVISLDSTAAFVVPYAFEVDDNRYDNNINISNECSFDVDE